MAGERDPASMGAVMCWLIFGAVVLIFVLAICKASGDADRQAEKMREATRKEE